MNIIKQIKRVAIVAELAPGAYRGTWSGYEIRLEGETYSELVLETTEGVRGACYVDVIVSDDRSIPMSVEIIGPAPLPGME